MHIRLPCKGSHSTQARHYLPPIVEGGRYQHHGITSKWHSDPMSGAWTIQRSTERCTSARTRSSQFEVRTPPLSISTLSGSGTGRLSIHFRASSCPRSLSDEEGPSSWSFFTRVNKISFADATGHPHCNCVIRPRALRTQARPTFEATSW